LVKECSDANKEVEYAMNMRNYLKSSDVTVVKCFELRKKNDHGSTLEVVFDTKDTDIIYNTAGNLAIYAENTDKHVEAFAKRMNFDLSMSFYIENDQKYTGPKKQFPIPAGRLYTVRDVLTKFVSLTGPLSKKMIKELATKCESVKEKDELLAMCAMGSSKVFEEKI